jgi:hypothetical protein
MIWLTLNNCNVSCDPRMFDAVNAGLSQVINQDGK